MASKYMATNGPSFYGMFPEFLCMLTWALISNLQTFKVGPVFRNIYTYGSPDFRI